MSVQNKHKPLLSPPEAPTINGREVVHRAPLDALTCSPAVKQLIAALAHDAKQPLSAIGAEAAACRNWLAEEPRDVGRVLASLHAMEEDARRASELIDQVRALLAPPLPLTLSQPDD